MMRPTGRAHLEEEARDAPGTIHGLSLAHVQLRRPPELSRTMRLCGQVLSVDLPERVREVAKWLPEISVSLALFAGLASSLIGLPQRASAQEGCCRKASGQLVRASAQRISCRVQPPCTPRRPPHTLEVADTALRGSGVECRKDHRITTPDTWRDRTSVRGTGSVREG